MKKITLQKSSVLGKDELKSIIGGDIIYERCSCQLKKTGAYGTLVNLPLTYGEQALIDQSSSVSGCVSLCEQICHGNSLCRKYIAQYEATGYKLPQL